VTSHGNPSLKQKESLQFSIDDRVAKLEGELDSWYAEVPVWFSRLKDDGPSVDEDINTTHGTTITPGEYPHISVALVLGWAIGIRIQFFRIRYPDAPSVPPRLGSLCHTLLRILAFLPTSTDGSM
jgi:hypothetical protein